MPSPDITDAEREVLATLCPAATEFRGSAEELDLYQGIAAIFPNGAKMGVRKWVFNPEQRLRFVISAGNALNQWWEATGRHHKPEGETDAR